MSDDKVETKTTEDPPTPEPTVVEEPSAPVETPGGQFPPPPKPEPTKAELKEEAKALGVKVSGTKEELKQELFFDGYWKNHKRYKCPHCPFDTLKGASTILQHIAERHVSVTVSAISGPDGKPIVSVETQS